MMSFRGFFALRVFRIPRVSYISLDWFTLKSFAIKRVFFSVFSAVHAGDTTGFLRFKLIANFNLIYGLLQAG